MKLLSLGVYLGLFSGCFFTPSGAQAQDDVPPFVICSNKSSGVLSVKKKCGTKQTKVANLQELVGPAGAIGATGATGAIGQTGSDGANGSLAIYGDGSAGDRTFDSTTYLEDESFQYASVTIDAGQTLTVPSGAVIRCTGDFINNGTIVVDYYAVGAARYDGSLSASSKTSAFQVAGEGISGGSAMNGEIGDDTASIQGGGEASGMYETTARRILLPGPNGGGGGGYSRSGGGRGAGTLVILCKGSVTNNGTIAANGETPPGDGGGGGGAGGIIVLASLTSVTNSNGAIISANGGDGCDSSTTNGAGGGGGGGIIHFVSPVNSPADPSSDPDITTTGGALGSNSVQITATLAVAGGSGGSCGGGGGDGSSVGAGRPVTAGGGNPTGYDGWVLATAADPTSLF